MTVAEIINEFVGFIESIINYVKDFFASLIPGDKKEKEEEE